MSASSLPESVLIANRGEIALRVIRTCRALGVRSIAIFTELDAEAPHVREADDAVPVAGYLDIDAVVAAATDSRAAAIHPGYGFLSERAEFVRAVEAAGIVFIGPSAEVMERMGRKDAARELAVSAGVPVVPTGVGAPYPVLVKAAAGGGGKGMRIVRTEAEFDEAVASAKREALSAFGDDTILVEKYVERGRHIEVQVLADQHGRVLHFFERDCSTQRRHQKVLEEAPAPTIGDRTRQVVTSAAVALAEHVGYTNAGTVEFLVDDDTGEAYFLEMNTRLQVEHPVTELVTRINGEPVDLVALQLRIAAGEKLGFTQDDIELVGHAIEARVYAEDSFGGFLPQAGTATLVRWPPGVRVDQALESGQIVSTSYDPMLGKVIAYGSDREVARRRLVEALEETVILGLTTNVGFLCALVAGPEFADAAIDTAWLDRTDLVAPGPAKARVFAAWAVAEAARSGPAHPFSSDGWRSGAPPAPLLVDLDEQVVVDPVRGRVGDHEVRGVRSAGDHHQLRIDGVREHAVVQVRSHVTEVVHRGQRFLFERPDPFAEGSAAAGDGSLAAPMPGTVLAVDVGVGDRVEAGTRLGVIEAMKMELALRSPFTGTVRFVGAGVGDQVQLKQLLFTVEATDE